VGTLAINPNFQQQGSRPLPMFFGYALMTGDVMIPFTCEDGSALQYIAVADGDCDGIEMAAYSTSEQLFSTMITPAVVTPAANAVLPVVNVAFHSGTWTPIGIPQTAASNGSDQGVDSFFGQIPSITPPQSFSNISYIRLYAPISAGAPGKLGWVPTTPASLFAVMRGTRCRYFDVDGNVTGYGFTTNPVWHRVEMLLRYKIKRQQPQIAGLTAAERACFNWPSIVALAERNDFVLPNGSPRFMGNYVFASQATLASMLETSCRCDRSYIDDQDGQIAFYGHDVALPSFALTGTHIQPGTWKCEKKDLTNAPNVFIPTFRDLNIQALVPVRQAYITNQSGLSDGTQHTNSGPWQAWFDTGGQNPFPGSAIFRYGDGSNPALNHDYLTVNLAPPATDTAPDILAWCPSDLSAQGVATSIGGYIGTQTSRFGQRAPNTVQHSRHQSATAAVRPGIATLANVKPVKYDLGNMTYDQANRLMQYEMNRTLGLNVTGWVAPQTGSVTVNADAVDALGNLFDRLRPQEQLGTFTIDDTVSPENVAAGNTTFVITKMTLYPPSSRYKLGAIEVEFESALPSAGYPDASYTPDSSLLTIASAALPQLGKSNILPYQAWTIQATPQWAGSTVTIPDLTVQVLGEPGYRTYPNAVFSNVPTSGPFKLWIADETYGVTTPEFNVGSPTGIIAFNSIPVYVGGQSQLLG
jgi:hypothetical protein